MTSWRLAADLAPDRRLVAAAVVAHATAALLPWGHGMPVPLAVGLSLGALLLLPRSLRCLAGAGRVLGLAIDDRCCAVRTASGWWPASPDHACRVYPGLVLFYAATADGRVTALISRGSLGPIAFRRLKALLRCGAGGGARLC
jgi:hypothetical protein